MTSKADSRCYANFDMPEKCQANQISCIINSPAFVVIVRKVYFYFISIQKQFTYMLFDIFVSNTAYIT